MRLLRAIVIRARVDGRIERPDIFFAVRSCIRKANTPWQRRGSPYIGLDSPRVPIRGENRILQGVKIGDHGRLAVREVDP